MGGGHASMTARSAHDGVDDAVILRRILYYPRLRRVAAFVLANLEGSLCLSGAAQVVFMNDAAFSRYFTSKAGLPFSAFVRRMRVLRAMERIEAEDCNFKNLAAALGFGSVSTLDRNFRSVCRCSPREYRRQILSRGADDGQRHDRIEALRRLRHSIGSLADPSCNGSR